MRHSVVPKATAWSGQEPVPTPMECAGSPSVDQVPDGATGSPWVTQSAGRGTSIGALGGWPWRPRSTNRSPSAVRSTHTPRAPSNRVPVAERQSANTRSSHRELASSPPGCRRWWINRATSPTNGAAASSRPARQNSNRQGVGAWPRAAMSRWAWAFNRSRLARARLPKSQHRHIEMAADRLSESREVVMAQCVAWRSAVPVGGILHNPGPAIAAQ